MVRPITAPLLALVATLAVTAGAQQRPEVPRIGDVPERQSDVSQRVRQVGPAIDPDHARRVRQIGDAGEELV